MLSRKNDGAPVAHAQNVTEMMVRMMNVNMSSETLVYNSSLLEDQLNALEERLRLLQQQADEDALLIDDVIKLFSVLLIHILSVSAPRDMYRV